MASHRRTQAERNQRGRALGLCLCLLKRISSSSRTSSAPSQVMRSKSIFRKIQPLGKQLAHFLLTRLLDRAITKKRAPLGALVLSTHSHSIINRSRKPAWLKGFAMIDMGPYRRFYRHPTRDLSGAEDGEICRATTLATPSSITF